MMKQYIDKSVIIDEIEKKLQDIIASKKDVLNLERIISRAKIDMCKEILSFINTIETKDVDIEKEVINWWNAHYGDIKKNYTFEGYTGHYLENFTLIEIAKYFYELGLSKK